MVSLDVERVLSVDFVPTHNCKIHSVLTGDLHTGLTSRNTGSGVRQGPLHTVPLVSPLAPFADPSVTVEARHPRVPHPKCVVGERVEYGSKLFFRFAQVPNGTSFDSRRRA